MPSQARKADLTTSCVQGDALRLTLSTGIAATPANSRVEFALKVDRYSERRSHAGVPAYVWRAGWNGGVSPAENTGVVFIDIPADVTETWPRGSYEYALTVSDTTGCGTRTTAAGYVLVEVSAASPDPVPPYRRASHRHRKGVCHGE
jgi:hypothetical protein